MGNYELLKQAVAQVIKQNGNQEITGNIMQSTLNAIINAFASGATFKGMAHPDTIPESTDAKIFYIATENGEYTNFNDTYGTITVEDEAVIIYNTETEWIAESTGIITAERANKLEDTIVKTGATSFDGVVYGQINPNSRQLRPEEITDLDTIRIVYCPYWRFFALERSREGIQSAYYYRWWDYEKYNRYDEGGTILARTDRFFCSPDGYVINGQPNVQVQTSENLWSLVHNNPITTKKEMIK